MKEFLQRIDSVLLDAVFQPIADRLPQSLSVWTLAMSCQLGSVLFQFVSILAPILLYGASLGQAMEASLALMINIVFFLGLRRFEPLVRPGTANPLRPMFWGLRLIGLFFFAYQGWSLMTVPNMFILWAELSEISQMIFVVGLYFMACQPRPPMSRKRENKRVAALAPSPFSGL